MTLGLVKTGLPGARQTGDLYLADISIPPAVYRQLGLTIPPLFTRDTIIDVAPAHAHSKGQQP